MNLRLCLIFENFKGKCKEKKIKRKNKIKKFFLKKKKIKVNKLCLHDISNLFHLF